MHRHFEDELNNLKEQLLKMGSHVESSVGLAIKALLENKTSLLKEVHDLEQKINRDHMEVDEACVQLLARQSPLAADLRLVIAILKISTDLERMGDQAENIAFNAKEYLAGKPIKQLIDIPSMAEKVQVMVKEALDAFLRKDRELAKKILEKDDEVDALKDKVFHDLIERMAQAPDQIEQALNLILIARNLERIGDHATNIAEDVIFAVTGDDIRHGSNIEE
ncbi:MAG: phosphate signaling complex protein PhoU [Oligoflexia bacterium]|nr:phosphate signaling complex protein PhoU [Oligoflexia bacterium]